MSNDLSNELKAQIFGQESDDPFLTLVTLRHNDFTARLVNNSVDIVSRGNTFTATPMKVRLPPDDGESSRDFSLEIDNISLELIENMRSVTDSISVQIELILASLPDTVQMNHEDLVIRTINYNAQRISAQIFLDSFLAVEMTSEKYTPTLYPGLFQ